MAYRLLGSYCKPQTLSYTSNHKFFHLNSDVYKKKSAYIEDDRILNYNMVPSQLTHDNPELLKSYGKSLKHSDINFYNCCNK